ncbi:hypothetical protein ACUXHY_004433 [Cytobacillus horneckiae]|uniref:hypothetical protein n=1 Tax=Cytobacillus horneckiae TaxID=549687 RepID=UPI001F149EE4|nr:hypothetical protein [Cytobacillus horneckiae]
MALIDNEVLGNDNDNCRGNPYTPVNFLCNWFIWLFEKKLLFSLSILNILLKVVLTNDMKIKTSNTYNKKLSQNIISSFRPKPNNHFFTI